MSKKAVSFSGQTSATEGKKGEISCNLTSATQDERSPRRLIALTERGVAGFARLGINDDLDPETLQIINDVFSRTLGPCMRQEEKDEPLC